MKTGQTRPPDPPVRRPCQLATALEERAPPAHAEYKRACGGTSRLRGEERRIDRPHRRADRRHRVGELAGHLAQDPPVCMSPEPSNSTPAKSLPGYVLALPRWPVPTARPRPPRRLATGSVLGTGPKPGRSESPRCGRAASGGLAQGRRRTGRVLAPNDWGRARRVLAALPNWPRAVAAEAGAGGLTTSSSRVFGKDFDQRPACRGAGADREVVRRPDRST